jgi:hypothetical protein
VIWFLAILLGIVAAVAGWAVTAVLAMWLGGLAGMSDFEGGRGMFAVFGAGPIGGLVAMVATIRLVLRIGSGRATVGATLARIAMVLAGIAAVVGGGMAVWVWSIDTYSNELPPQLEFEIRLPQSMAVAAKEDVDIELNTDRNTADALFRDPWQRAEGDHQIIAALVELAFKTTGRLLVVKLRDQPTRLFRLRLSRNPDSTKAMSDWQQADHIDDPTKDQPQPAPKGDPVMLRYRVTRAGDEP